MIRVVDDECRFAGGEGIVVIEGNDPERVRGLQAKQAAIQKGVEMGMYKPGISLSGNAFPASANPDNPQAAPAGGGGLYRAEFKLAQGL